MVGSARRPCRVECAHRNIERALEELRLIAEAELPKFNPRPAAAIVRRMWRGHEQMDDVTPLTFKEPERNAVAGDRYVPL